MSQQEAVEGELVRTSLVHRNQLYLLVSRSNATVVFRPSHSLGSMYPVCYQCSPEAWDSGNPFSKEDFR